MWSERKAFSAPHHSGFALVATILLMVLLAIITLGTLSISAVTLRTGTQDLAQSKAKANARMALMIAIGELQKHAGPDTRITASADILDPTNPPLTGVWISWEGSDHQSSGILTGRPIKPDYATKLKNTSQNGRFLTWLVSGAHLMTSPSDAASLVSSESSTETIPLVSAGSVAEGDARQVHVKPITVNDGGAFAWWVSGENQKAHLPKPKEPKNDNAAAWSEVARSHTVADPEVFELDPLLTDPSPAQKAFTRNTADIFAKPGVCA